MPRLSSYLLDRANEILVQLRLRGRHPRPDRERIAAYLDERRGPLHPSPAELPAFRPRCEKAGRRVERWIAESPWPQVEGANSSWWAVRVKPAAVATSDTPRVVLLHGWLVTRLQLRLYRHHAARLARRGVEVWVPCLPHHMTRAEAGRVSGERFLSSDFIATVESLRQAVAETRALGAWLRQSGGGPVSLWGTSLGGWVAALVASLERDWASLALWAPVASPSQVLWEAELTRDMRAAVSVAGIEPGDELAHLDGYALVPNPPLLPRHRVLLIAGVWDRVIDAATVAALARAWSVDVAWSSQGHIGLMTSPSALRATVDFLQR